MKTMSIQSAIIDTIMWTLVNFVVGAVTAKILSLQNKQGA